MFLAQLVDDVVIKKWEITKAEISIGRHPTNDIQIDEISVSGHHALIVLEEHEFFENQKSAFLRDLGSTNGSFVNEIKVLDRQQLRNKDDVKIAYNNFKFINEAEIELEQTAHILQE